MRLGKKLVMVAIATATTLAMLTSCSHSPNQPTSGILTVAQVQMAVQADQQRFFNAHEGKPVQIIGYVIDVEVSRIYLGATGTEQPDDGSFNIQVDVPGSESGVNIGDQVTVAGLVVPLNDITVWIPQGSVVSVLPGTSFGDGSFGDESPSSSPTPALGPDSAGAGIIIVSSQKDPSNFGSAILNVSAIDPVTGVSTFLRTFKVTGTDSTCVIPTPSLSQYLARLWFDQDYRRVAATCKADDGQHVGWFDETGTFTDVTAAISIGGSDFSKSRSDDMSGQFFGGNFYWFADDKPSGGFVGGEIKQVPMDNLNASAVTILADDWQSKDFTINTADGSLYLHYCCTLVTSPSGDGFGPVNGQWISDSTYVTDYNGNDRILVGKAVAGNDTRDLSEEPFLPSVTGRTNWNPIVAPDKTQVAFLSNMSETELYVVSPSGQDPQKVPTDFQFDRHDVLIDWT